MNLNLIFEEIKVDSNEGKIEVLETVKIDERIETIVNQYHYKLEKISSQELLNRCKKDCIKYKFFKRNFFEKLIFKRDKNHLLKFIFDKSSNYSWILCPKYFLSDIKSSKVFSEKLVFESDDENFIFGNFDSAIIIKNGEFCQIIQKSPLKMVKIS